MKVRKSCWQWISMALCLPAAVSTAAIGFADETDPKPPLSAVQDVLFNLQVAEPAPQVDGVEIVVDTVATPPANLTQVLVGGAPGAAFVYAEPGAQDKFWIGLICADPGEALRTQLDLATGEGLLVEQVSDGPAKKAGLQRHDLLLKATIPSKSETESHRLSNPQDLVKAVQVAETKGLKIEFLRRGKKQVLEVTPEERPKTPHLEVVNFPYPLGDVTGNVNGTPGAGVTLRWAGPMIVGVPALPLPPGMTIEFQPHEGQPEKVIVKQGDRTWESEIKSMDKLPEEISTLVRQQLDARRATAVRTNSMFHRTVTAGAPSLVVHGSARLLPPDVTLTVVRKGMDPARINVKKGDLSWDVTETELSKLPVDIRSIVETALNPPRIRTTQAVLAPTPVYTRLPVQSADNVAKPVTRSVKNPTEIERQLKDLAEQVEKLRQAVEKTSPKQ